ncbi:hypothetical protein DSECCO2_435510 [anaerobic digester metagenome]
MRTIFTMASLPCSAPVLVIVRFRYPSVPTFRASAVTLSTDTTISGLTTIFTGSVA